MTISTVVGAVLLASPMTSAAPARADVPAVAAWNTPWAPPAAADQKTAPNPNPPTTPWQPPAPVPHAAKSFTASPDSTQTVPQTTVPAPGLGSLPYDSFNQTNLSLDTVAQVNLGNGNLLLTSSDGVLNGPGLALRNDRFYNGLSNAQGSFGGGWSDSLSQIDVGLSTTATTATYRGPNGFSAKFTLSGTTYTAPEGFNATLTTNSSSTNDRYTMQYNSSGETIDFSSSGYVTSDTDRNGTGSQYAYNSAGQVSTATDAAGRQFTVSWSGNTPSLITHVDDSAGRDWQYDSNSSGQLTRVTKPDNNFEEYTYDSTGRVATAEFSGTSNGDVIYTFGYDSSNRVTSLTSALVSSPATTLSSTTYAYTSGKTTVTDGNGHTTSYAIDSSGRVTSTTDALGNLTSSGFKANTDNVSTTTAPLESGQTAGSVTTYAYDSLNNATGVSYPTGAAGSATYANSSSCTTAQAGLPSLEKCTKDSSSNTTSTQYDTAGNLLNTTDTTSTSSHGTGATTQKYTYENSTGSICGGLAGQKCTSTNGDGGVTSYTYDSNGNLTTVAPPSPLGATTFQYDSLGRVTSVTDGDGNVTQYTYNQRDDILQTTYNGGKTLNTAYYQDDLRQSDTDSAQGEINYSYDGLGRLTSQTGPVNTTSQSYTYDEVGNVLTYADQNGTTTYTYDADNHVLSLQEPGGTCTAGTAVPAASSGCVKFSYYNGGGEKQRTFPGGAKIVTTYDLSARVTRITATSGTGTVVSDIGYSYGVGGSTTAANDRATVQQRTSYKEVGVTAGAITTYTYDSLDRLLTATEKSGTTQTAAWTYTYDKAGNRTSQLRSGTTGATAGTITTTYNNANEITGATGATGTWSYDADGNQTSNGATSQSQAVNSAEAVTAEGSTNYTAFGGGNDTTLTRSASSSSYTNSALGLMSETTSAGTTAYTRTASGALVASRAPSGADLYYVLDAGGSVVGMFDKTGAFVGGYSYSPYGETRSSTTNGTAANNALVASNSMRYGGGYYDSAAGLYRFGARYYDPTLGRFTQADPSGGESNPYSYASDSPINSADISGLFSLGFSVKGCFYICLSVGLSQDQDGHVGLTGGLGAGNPSLSGSLSGSTGDVSTGVGGEVGCSAGPVSADVSTSGDVDASVGTDYSTGECDAEVTGELQLS